LKTTLLCLLACLPFALQAVSIHPKVLEANQAVAQAADLSDPASFADAKRGFIAAPKGVVKNAQGEVVWDYEGFAFVTGAAPPTVNPSLWRQALLNNQIGLFKVTEGIWQLRGFDLANITLIEGKTGWIVVDALTCQETAAAAMAFARQHLSDKKVSGVVFTHSHVDHFGGVLGVISAQEAKARQVPVVAPSGFMEEATSENVLMGTAMQRRAMYMFGTSLPRNPEGVVDTGLGKSVATGRIGILPPTVSVEQPTQAVTIDGVRFVFQNVPGSEAPSEFTFYLPDFKAFSGAEIMGHTLHNLYTLRGAKVRDAHKWAAYLDASLSHAAEAEVVFNQHHWPVWGKARIKDFIEKQRDTYQYIHDQTVRHMNAGKQATEIAELITLPKALQDNLNMRGYYGTVSHNVKAVYQFYLGWFDAHPSNLHALPPLEAAKAYVELAGGLDKVVVAAQKAFDAANFRWAAELLKHAIYVAPQHEAAKALLISTYQQLAYLAESAIWRNFYLTGALELAQGPPTKGIAKDTLLDMLQHTPIERFLEGMGASLDGVKAASKDRLLNMSFSDLNENYVLTIKHGVLRFQKAPPNPQATATLTMTKAFFLRMVTGLAGPKDLVLSSEVKTSGSMVDLAQFFLLLDKSAGTFPIVTR
jgi:alkyl sulfatase BDS1-like metallo-beta-lactamase superfamily hydrolase